MERQLTTGVSDMKVTGDIDRAVSVEYGKSHWSGFKNCGERGTGEAIDTPLRSTRRQRDKAGQYVVQGRFSGVER